MMRRKGADDTGDRQAFICPARGLGKTLYCPLTQKSERDDAHAKRLQRVLKPQLPANPGKCCTNKASLAIPHSEGAKFRQTGPAYKTPEWAKTFSTFRNVIETRNDLVKNARGSANIGDHTRRLIRGFAAAWMFTAFGVIATNLSLIANFLWRITHNVTSPVPPNPPGKRPHDTHPTSGLPNGPPIEEGDEDEDDLAA